jgi:hypothetical protein
VKLGGSKPFEGVYDWEESFAQNPDEERYEIPLWMQIRVHGAETAEQARERALYTGMRRRQRGSTEPFSAVVV